MRAVLFKLLGLCLLILCSSWGFFAHKRINHLAVFTLPSSMGDFYRANLDFLTEHAVDPDKRRYADSLEAPRHFLDADYYGEDPFSVLPQDYQSAVAKFSEDTIRTYGTVPWQIEKTYKNLVFAMKSGDKGRILQLSADLGHYIGDAHVPLHTTINYNGQLTGQHGIHAFWESRLPELFSEQYNFYVGKAQYVSNPLKEAWRIVSQTYAYKDSVLLIEARLRKSFPEQKKYTFTERAGKVDRQISVEYAAAYHKALNGMVEQQMRRSIHAIGSFWYSAWVDAGQPDLDKLQEVKLSKQEKQLLKEQQKMYKQGKYLGRPEPN